MISKELQQLLGVRRISAAPGESSRMDTRSHSEGQEPEPRRSVVSLEQAVQGAAKLPQVASRTAIERLYWLGRVFISAASRFYWDDGLSRAAALAYTSLLSLVPFSVVAFGLLASFATSTEYIGRAREFLFKQFVPDAQFVNDVLHYIENFSSAAAQFNVTFLLVLVVTSLLLVNSVEYALNATWQVYEPRPWHQRVAIFSAMLLVAPPMLLSGYYFYEKFAQTDFLVGEGIARVLYRSVLPHFFDWIAFLMLYFLVPKAPVRFRYAAFGALIAAVFFNLAKVGFAIYLRDFASYSTLYKSIAAVPVSLVWLYLSWIILLYGAELCYQAQYLPRSGKLFKRSVLSVGDARMMLAIQSLVMIQRAFSAGSRLPNDIELAESLGCSTVVLKPTIDALEQAGIVMRGDSRDMPITLLKSASCVSVAEVRSALFGTQAALHFPDAMARLFRGLAVGQRPSEITLEDLVCGEAAEEDPGAQRKK